MYLSVKTTSTAIYQRSNAGTTVISCCYIGHFSSKTIPTLSSKVWLQDNSNQPTCPWTWARLSKGLWEIVFVKTSKAGIWSKQY